MEGTVEVTFPLKEQVAMVDFDIARGILFHEYLSKFGKPQH